MSPALVVGAYDVDAARRVGGGEQFDGGGAAGRRRPSPGSGLLGRARSFSTWLRKGTDRPLRSATTARVSSSARRRRRTAAPTRRGCSLWSPIAPAPSFARRSAYRPDLRPRSSDEFSAPYACSANRFMRPSHPCKPAGGPCSHFTPVEPLSHLRFRGPSRGTERGAAATTTARVALPAHPVTGSPVYVRRVPKSFRAATTRSERPPGPLSPSRSHLPWDGVGTRPGRSRRPARDPSTCRKGPGNRWPGHPAVVRICLVRQYVTTLARSGRLRTAEPRLGHFTRRPSRRRSPDARRSSSGRPRPVRAQGLLGVGEPGEVAPVVRPVRRPERDGDRLLLLVRAVQRVDITEVLDLRVPTSSDCALGVKPRRWRISFAGRPDADGHRDREDGRAGA